MRQLSLRSLNFSKTLKQKFQFRFHPTQRETGASDEKHQLSSLFLSTDDQVSKRSTHSLLLCSPDSGVMTKIPKINISEKKLFRTGTEKTMIDPFYERSHFSSSAPRTSSFLTHLSALGSPLLASVSPPLLVSAALLHPVGGLHIPTFVVQGFLLIHSPFATASRYALSTAGPLCLCPVCGFRPTQRETGNLFRVASDEKHQLSYQHTSLDHLLAHRSHGQETRPPARSQHRSHFVQEQQLRHI